MTALNQNTLFAHSDHIAELNLYLFVLKNSLTSLLNAAEIPEGDEYLSKISDIFYAVHGAGNSVHPQEKASKNEFLHNISVVKQEIDALLISTVKRDESSSL